MEEHDDFPTPEVVDDQIERLSTEADDLSPATRLVHDLRNTYQPYATKDTHSLERVWERLAHSGNQMYSRQGGNNQPIDPMKIRQERSQYMISNSRRVSRWTTLQRRSGIAAAILFLTLLVGSMIIVLNYAHQGNTQTGSLSHPVAPVHKSSPTTSDGTAPIAPQNQGKTLYSYHTIDISTPSHGPPIARVSPWGRILSCVNGMQPAVSTSSPTIPILMAVPACFPWHGHLMDNVLPTEVETSRYGTPKQVICISPSHPHNLVLYSSPRAMHISLLM